MSRQERKPRILFVFGTRPEAIKMAPLIMGMKSGGRFTPRVCVTAQHREMLDQVLGIFSIKPHHDLGIMRPGQGLTDITLKCLPAVSHVIGKERPDLVIVQGDTTTSFASALAAFYMGVPVGHVEAGLRTWDRSRPFPEEMNRSLISQLANLHFAPTTSARDNLIRCGVPGRHVHVTGNTVVDALMHIRKSISPAFADRLLARTLPMNAGGRLVLVTAHRRENFGSGMNEILGAIRDIALGHGDVEFVFPVHPNPNVSKKAARALKGVRNIRMIQPLDYRSFVCLMDRSYLLLTDSGGIQEEACYLGKPVVVMRETTERTEAVRAGNAVLAGAHRERIIASVSRILDDVKIHRRMAKKTSPFGRGNASARIISVLEKRFG